MTPEELDYIDDVLTRPWCFAPDEIRAAREAIMAEVRRLRLLAQELLAGYEDACNQGTGEVPLSSPTWHHFISTWEEADELIPRARAMLGGAGAV